MAGREITIHIPTERGRYLHHALAICASLNCELRRSRGLKCPSCESIADALASERKDAEASFGNVLAGLQSKLKAEEDEHRKLRDSMLELLGVGEDGW